MGRPAVQVGERNAGDVADLGAAAFVFAVDSFDVVGDRRRIGRTIVAEPAAWELVGGAGRCRQTTRRFPVRILTLPNSEAPVGQTSQHAGTLPSFSR